MAHFRGTLRGKSGKLISRLGDKYSGMTATLDGWNFGVCVYIRYSSILEKDCISIYLTKGSNDLKKVKHLGVFTLEDLYRGKKRSRKNR